MWSICLGQNRGPYNRSALYDNIRINTTEVAIAALYWNHSCPRNLNIAPAPDLFLGSAFLIPKSLDTAEESIPHIVVVGCFGNVACLK